MRKPRPPRIGRRCFLKYAGGGVALVVGSGIWPGCSGSNWSSPGLLVLSDPRLCAGCNRCGITCSALHADVEENPLPLVDPDPFVSAQPPDPAAWHARSCHMCAEIHDGQTLVSPACVASCPTGAARIADVDDPDYGAARVRYIDRNACQGCGRCVQSCPWEHPLIQSGSARKCDLCAREASEPPCVAACPNRALRCYTTRLHQPPAELPW